MYILLIVTKYTKYTSNYVFKTGLYLHTIKLRQRIYIQSSELQLLHIDRSNLTIEQHTKLNLNPRLRNSVLYFE